MAVELQAADAGSWWDWVTNYDQTYQQFVTNYGALQNLNFYINTAHPELVGQYNDLMSRAQASMDQLNALKATRDYVYSWIQWLGSGAAQGVNFVTSAAQSTYDYMKSVLGLSGLGECSGNCLGCSCGKGQMAGLGIAPVVVIDLAAAVAALIVIGYWIKDAYNFAQRVNALQQQEAYLQAQGVPAAQAAQQAQAIVDNTLGPAPGSAASINSNLLGIPWTYLVFGAVAIFLGPPLIEAMGSKKGARA